MELTKTKTKPSPLGLIPSDWISGFFEDVLTGFSSGMTPYRGNPEYYKGRIPWITSGELNYNIINDTIEKITQEAVIKTNLKLLPVGTFLMAITGLEAAGTRGSCGITGVLATTNQSCMALYPINGKILTEYLYHFYVRYGNEFAFKYCQGTKQQSYTGKIARILPIILPPTLEEQKEIATALSDVDDLINNLEKLIAKKKNIKQGAMQQLLTPPNKGGKRLAGFTGEWVTKELGQVCHIKKGQLITESTRVNGEIPVIAGGKRPAYYNNKPNRNGKTITISGSGANAGYISFHVNPIFASDCSTIEESDEYCIEFILYFLQLMQNKIYKMQTGGAQPHIHPSDLNPMKIGIPSKTEQESIAKIIREMDLEIEAYELKSQKAALIKNGMMQELLTGKTRLI